MDNDNQLTDNARASLVHAEVLAHLSDSGSIETIHLLLAMLSIESSTAARILRSYGIDTKAIRSNIRLRPGVVISSGLSRMNLSEASALALRIAVDIAAQFKQEQCGTECILFALLCQSDSRAYKALSDQGIDVTELSSRISDYLDKTISGEETAETAKDTGRNKANSYIDRYSVDLTKLARAGELDPVIGRQREIDRLITIVSRRTKNNPVLIGEAGVGKTAVVEGLAQRVADGNVPQFLADRRVVSLDLAAMVAGTKYRGEFEERLKNLVREVEKDQKLIVFIDELHVLVGAGAGEGSMDASNILKPALARGRFHLIGATTSDEYRKYIEKDAAFTRRLQEVVLEAPSCEETRQILTGVSPRYESYHHVKITPSVIDEVVRLSERYLTERQQPDKAIDVLDETAARVHIAQSSNDLSKNLREYKQESGRLLAKMEKAVSDEDYEKAALYKMRLSQLKSKIEELEASSDKSGRASIKLNDIATTVSRMTGVPLTQLRRSEVAKLVTLEKRLSQRIIGQSAAVKAVAQAIRRSRAGIGDPGRPIGSFIFLGPTGVGKTELAKVLADEVFGSSDSLIKVDMSEFSQRHTVSRLLGAPAGYVGYDDGGQLTEKVRRQPYSVVLFDEIEKAHPDVFNILLQIIEDGVLTDGHGKKVDFRNCLIIVTGNIGATELAAGAMGFVTSGNATSSIDKNGRETVLKALRQTIRPELLNRFDQIVLFNSLGIKQMTDILGLMLTKLNQRLAHKQVAVVPTTKLRRYLVNHSYDPKYGARPLRRVLQEQLEKNLADQLISGKIKRGMVVQADWQDGAVTLLAQSEKAATKPLKVVKTAK